MIHIAQGVLWFVPQIQNDRVRLTNEIMAEELRLSKLNIELQSMLDGFPAVHALNRVILNPKITHHFGDPEQKILCLEAEVTIEGNIYTIPFHRPEPSLQAAPKNMGTPELILEINNSTRLTTVLIPRGGSVEVIDGDTPRMVLAPKTPGLFKDLPSYCIPRTV